MKAGNGYVVGCDLSKRSPGWGTRSFCTVLRGAYAPVQGPYGFMTGVRSSSVAPNTLWRFSGELFGASSTSDTRSYDAEGGAAGEMTTTMSQSLAMDDLTSSATSATCRPRRHPDLWHLAGSGLLVTAVVDAANDNRLLRCWSRPPVGSVAITAMTPVEAMYIPFHKDQFTCRASQKHLSGRDKSLALAGTASLWNHQRATDGTEVPAARPR